jgi:hypothetical protein
VKTTELIALLARGVDRVDAAQIRRRLWPALSAGSLAAMAMSIGLLRLNPVLLRLATEPRFWIREGFCLGLCATGIVLVGRLGRPARRLGLAPLGIIVPAAALWSLAVIVLVNAPPGARVPLIIGHTARACPFLIALLSAPVFAACIWLLRDLAPTHLRLAGAGAGFAAGAFGALAYTLHCPELAPPFIAVWYPLGISIPTSLGAWLGPRLLRW